MRWIKKLRSWWNGDDLRIAYDRKVEEMAKTIAGHVYLGR